MVLKYVISPSSIPNDFVAKVWEAESDGPGGEVYTSPTIPAPHAAPYELTISGLDRVTHILRLYDAVTDELIHEYTAEPKVDLTTVFDPIRFKIGDGGPNTPIAGTGVYQNDLLIGLNANEYIIHRNNYGELHPGIHYQIGLDIDGVPDGSWELLQVGDVFNGDPGEEFTIRRQPQNISAVVNDSVVGKWFGGFVDIAASRDYLSTDLRKLLRFTGTCTYTFPVGGTIPIGYNFVFTHFGTSNGIGTVQFLNAPLKWGGTTKTTFAVNRYCEAAFSFDGTQWNVVYITSSAEALGSSNPGDILGVGEVVLGNIPTNDTLYTVTHSKAIVGDYKVFLSLQGTAATAGIDNNTQVAWYHHASDKPNKFMMMVGEISSSVQNLTICYLLIKV